MSICQLCTENRLLQGRKKQSISLLSKWKRKVERDWQWSKLKATQNQTATKNNQVLHFEAETLFSELVPLKALFLKGEY